MTDARPVMGPYELLETVGKGGMATVYRGRRRTTGQIVAVKVMDPTVAANPLLVKRFEQEYAAGCRLRHPNLIQVWDFGVENGLPYLVMEFIEGETLSHRIKEEGPLAELEGVRIVLQVADGLHSAHQLGMIHRDVKSENVLLSRNGQAKLSDLGLMKDLHNDEPLTRTRTCLGTIAFVAPEQFEDAKRADARSDVYGLGATLYHALTGVLPFQGRRNLQILRKKLESDFVPPQQIVPTLSAQVNEAICRSLAAAPEKRQASCREFMESLLLDALPLEGPDGEPGAAALADDERRRAFRFPSDLSAECRALQAGRQTWGAKVLDISGTGARLRAFRRFEPGALLAVEVTDEPSDGMTLYAKVVWVRQAGAEEWSIGCEFKRELEPAELETLLGDKPKTVAILPD